MQRIPVTERPNLSALAVEHEFEYTPGEGISGWDESAYYQFSQDQIENDIVKPAEDLEELCFQVVERAVGNEEVLDRLCDRQAQRPRRVRDGPLRPRLRRRSRCVVAQARALLAAAACASASCSSAAAVDIIVPEARMPLAVALVVVMAHDHRPQGPLPARLQQRHRRRDHRATHVGARSCPCWQWL